MVENATGLSRRDSANLLRSLLEKKLWNLTELKAADDARLFQDFSVADARVGVGYECFVWL